MKRNRWVAVGIVGLIIILAACGNSGSSDSSNAVKEREEGSNSTTNKTPPLPTAIAAGFRNSCAVLASGSIKCWGNNEGGQLGDGTTTDSSVPVLVSGIATATAIAAGGYHSCAVLASGTIKCWGSNGYGQLGNGTTTVSNVPVLVSGITTAIAIRADDNHSCALLAGGTIKSWGDNNGGQLGNETNPRYSSVPVLVSGIATATAIDTGLHHSCAVLAGGTIKCWGDNNDGQLGDGGTTDSSVPVLVTDISTLPLQLAPGDPVRSLLVEPSNAGAMNILRWVSATGPPPQRM